MARRIRFRGARIEKRYLRADLLVDDRTLEHRTARIEQLSAEHYLFPQTSFHWDEDILVLSQDRIRLLHGPADSARVFLIRCPNLSIEDGDRTA
jgi:hypothetical protein